MYNNNDHIFKLNNRPLNNYPYRYPFQLSYCPLKSCCNDEYAKLNANNIFCKVNTFNDKVVINSGNLQIKDLASFPLTSPGFGNYASINGTPYFYNYITNNWINLLENNTFTLNSSPGIFTEPTTSNTEGYTTFTFQIPNTYGTIFDYTIHSNFPPEPITITDETTPIELQSPTSTSSGSLYGVGRGFAILQPYIYQGVNNAAYTFNSYSNPGFNLYQNGTTNEYEYLRTYATTNVSGVNTYTTSLNNDYSRNGNNTLIIIGKTIVN
jgi:hypothetical protein